MDAGVSLQIHESHTVYRIFPKYSDILTPYHTGRGFDPRRFRKHSFVEIDHEIFSTVILSLPLIEEGQLSFSGERMYASTG